MATTIMDEPPFLCFEVKDGPQNEQSPNVGKVPIVSDPPHKLPPLPLLPYRSPQRGRRDSSSSPSTRCRSPLRYEFIDVKSPATPSPTPRRGFPWTDFDDEGIDVSPHSPVCVEQNATAALDCEDYDAPDDPFATPPLAERPMLPGSNVMQRFQATTLGAPLLSGIRVMPTRRNLPACALNFSATEGNHQDAPTLPSPTLRFGHTVPKTPPCSRVPSVDHGRSACSTPRQFPLLAWPVGTRPSPNGLPEVHAPPSRNSESVERRGVPASRSCSPSAVAPVNSSPFQKKKRTWQSVFTNALRFNVRKAAKAKSVRPSGYRTDDDGGSGSCNDPLADMSDLYSLVQDAISTVDPALKDDGPLSPMGRSRKGKAARKSLRPPSSNKVLLVTT
eukprot:Rmarinus@m.3805